jgi:hypothetical protein
VSHKVVTTHCLKEAFEFHLFHGHQYCFEIFRCNQ